MINPNFSKTVLLKTVYQLFLITLVSTTLSYSVFGQVSFHKRNSGSVGVAPQPGSLQNAASLDNLDYASGTLKIGITLYEIKVKDISVPISVNYSATGLKANQKAGCVGMGWELNAGGGETVTVNGLPDNSTYGISSNNPMMQLLQNSSTSLDVANNGTHQEFAAKCINGERDGAWDIHNYSLPNGGGKYMGYNRLTFPYNPLFAITEKGLTVGDGLFYTFTPGETKKITKRTFYTKTFNPLFTTDWAEDSTTYTSREDLHNITSARNKDTVSFQYEHFNNVFCPWPTVTTTTSVPMVRHVSFNTSFNEWQAENSYHFKEANYSQTMVETTSSSRVKYINFPNGRVMFDYYDDYKGQDVLWSITVQVKEQGAYKKLKKFSFGYDYNYSHYLTEIVATDENGDYVNSWKFNYYDFMPVNITSGNTGQGLGTEPLAQDRWGFYNAQTGNKTLVEDPREMLLLQSEGSDAIVGYDITRKSKEANYIYGSGGGELPMSFAKREFVFSEAIKGTLKSVETPSGALVEYEYEPHVFKHLKRSGKNGPTSTEIKIGGGIRIKSITHRSESTGKMLLRKEYEYGESDHAGWVLYPINIAKANSTYSTSYDPDAFVSDDYSLLSHPLNDMNYSSGSYAIYPSVSEYFIKDTVENSPNKYSGKNYYTFYTTNYPNTDHIKDNWLNTGVNNDTRDGKLYSFTKYRAESKLNSSGAQYYDFLPVEGHSYYWNKFIVAPSFNNPLANYSYFGYIAKVRTGHYITSGFEFCVPAWDEATHTYKDFCESLSLESSDPSHPQYFGNIEYETSDTYYPGKYSGITVDMSQFSDCYKITKEEVHYYGTSTDNEPYFNTDHTLYSDTTNYVFGDHLQPKEIKYTMRGGKYSERIKYSFDYPTGNGFGSDFLKNSHIYNEPVEQLTTVMIADTEYVIRGNYNAYNSIDNNVVQTKEYSLNTHGVPLPYSSFTLVQHPNYELRSTADLYSADGNLLEFHEANGPKTSLVWGYQDQSVVAKIDNAQYSDVAYSGFECPEMGNWIYSGGIGTVTLTPEGTKAYSLTSGAISKSDLDTQQSYVIAYWAKQDAQVNITGGNISPEKIKRSYMGWNYIERELTASSLVNISGTGFIDGLRLHPIDALMSTYTFEPLNGMDGVTDASGKASYYDYDTFQRLRQIKDQDGNISKRVEYNFKH